jgi:hypothetical protein
MSEETQNPVQLMVDWFLANYENPVERTPYESAEGGYQYIWGGPYYPEQELNNKFGETYSAKDIEAATEKVCETAFEWTCGPEDRMREDQDLRAQDEADAQAALASKSFLIGQRVIVGDEIGKVQRGPTLVGDSPVPAQPMEGYVWVHLPSRGYASHFSIDIVKPLPGGQL